MESAGGMWVEYEIGNGTLGIGCYGEVWKPSPDGTCIAFEADNFDAEISTFEGFTNFTDEWLLPDREFARSEDR